MNLYYREILEQLNFLNDLVKRVRDGDNAYESASRIDISCLEQAFFLNNILQDIKHYIQKHFYEDGVSMMSQQDEDTLINTVLSKVYDEYAYNEYHALISDLLEKGFNKLKTS